MIVDDNKDLLVALKLLLSPYFIRVQSITNPNLIPGMLSSNSFDILILDMNFGEGHHSGNEGLFWMRRVLEHDPDICVVFITAYGDIELAVRSIKEGAVDFIQKAWEEEKILSTVLAAYKIRQSKLEIKRLRNKQKHLNENINRQQNFCAGKSRAMQDIMETIGKVSATDANILILGANGTGKEVLAREIHKRSGRAEEIFVSVNITSLSEGLFESEMFGHVKGAFTDAKTDRAGRFEIASGGTLFLDEIGDLNMALQSKLLSALQNREITRIGAHAPSPVDIRLICATNKDLDKLVAENKFREDLLYRINTIQIQIPGLQERPEDLSELIDFYTLHYAEKYGRSHISVSREAREYLACQSWPGNVRQLQHAIERAVIMADATVLTAGDFDKRNAPAALPADQNVFSLPMNEKYIIRRALEKFKGNIRATAQALEINRSTLYDKIRKYDL